MDVIIGPGTLRGTIKAIPAKSELHRALICAAFADRPTEVLLDGRPYAAGIPDDIRATVSCLQALGAGIGPSENGFSVGPVRSVPEDPVLDCLESGSTLRFMLPVAAAVSGHAAFTGSGRLPDRPVSELVRAMESHGVSFTADRLPLETHGRLEAGDYEIPGNVSSQYITGLLLAFPLLKEACSLRLTTALHSADYVHITLDVLSRFGVRIAGDGSVYQTEAAETYRSPGTVRIGGDWSNAAAFLVMGVLGAGNDVTAEGLDPDSSQGDRAVTALLRAMGGSVINEQNGVRAVSSPLRSAEIDIDPTPDLMPVLAAAACGASGTTVFRNAGRLRLKESDRIRSTADLIRSLGGAAEEGPDYLAVTGTGRLKGGTADAGGDHRLVMAAAAASCIADGPVRILGAEAVNKSYPSFFNDFKTLGGNVHVVL